MDLIHHLSLLSVPSFTRGVSEDWRRGASVCGSPVGQQCPASVQLPCPTGDRAWSVTRFLPSLTELFS
jgi:hypothetical protein